MIMEPSTGYTQRGFLGRHAQAYLFMLPAILLAGAVSLYPIAYAFFLSLFRTRYLERVAFIGLGNYRQLFADPAYQQNLIYSLTYVFGSLIVVLPFSLGVAILLNQRVKHRAVFRALIILPWVVSQTIIALLWGWLLNPDFGPGIYALELLGVGKVGLFTDSRSALPTLIGVNVWGSYPMAVILLLAALQTIPKELKEAARVDGTSRWQHFVHITLPLVQPTLLVATIMLTLLYFNMVTLVLILTGGGPLGATEVLSLRAFKEGFDFWHVGYAATLGIVIFFFNVVFSLLYIRLLRQEGLQ
ncbi:MAG: carbohydrate ABC transporter permease [Candidatus Methylomirabilales bacterium]